MTRDKAETIIQNAIKKGAKLHMCWNKHGFIYGASDNDIIQLAEMVQRLEREREALGKE